MIGILLVAHANLGHEMIKAGEIVFGKVQSIGAVSVLPELGTDEIRDSIKAAIKKLDKGKGVLILTDMLGGTPSNISFTFLKEGKVEVITGVNLPMLVRAVTHRDKCADLTELAGFIKKDAPSHILVASEMIKKERKRTGGRDTSAPAS